MPLLEVDELSFSYGNALVLDAVSLHVDEGEIVTLIGPNGAGKSTLLGAVSQALRPRRGSLRLADEEVLRVGQSGMVRRGCLLVPEGRQVFGAMTVLDNLLLGGFVHRRGGGGDADLRSVYELFPRLEERGGQLAGTLSGGEQQMLAIGRAIMGRPRVVLLDEPSLGLSPQLVERIFGALADLRQRGLTILLVEQNARAALRLADRGYLLQAGRVITEGAAEELAEDERVKHVYLGASAS